MQKFPEQGELFPSEGLPEGTRVINERCLLRTRDGFRVVIGAGVVLSQYALGDRMAEAHAMVDLVEQGWADQNDVARGFGCSVRTLRRHQRRFEDGGLSALGRARGYPKGRRRLKESRRKLVHQLKAEGHSNREIARRTGVTEVAVRKLLRRLGWKEEERPVKQALFPFGDFTDANPKLSAFSSSPPPAPAEEPVSDANPKLSAFRTDPDEPVPTTVDRDPANRVCDRLFAHLGLLDDAAPLFRPGTAERQLLLPIDDN